MVWTLRRILILIVLISTLAVVGTLIWVTDTYQRFAVDTQNEVTSEMVTYLVWQRVQDEYLNKVAPFIDEWSRFSTLVRGVQEDSPDNARLAANRMMYTLEVTSGRIRLRNIVVYSKDFEIVAQTDKGTGETIHALGNVRERKKRQGIRQRRMIDTYLWRSASGRPLHSTIAPIGGFRVAGFIEFVTDPLPELDGLGAILGGTFRLLDANQEILFEESTWDEDASTEIPLRPDTAYLETLKVHLPDATGGVWATVSLTRDTSIFHRAVLQLRDKAIWIVAIVVLSSVIIGWLLLRLSVFRQLSAFASAMENLTEGKTAFVAPVTGPDEFATMRTSLDSLKSAVAERHEAAERLSQSEANLRASEQRLTAMLEASPVGVAIAETHGRQLWVNPRAAEMIGRSADEIIGTTSAIYFKAPGRYETLRLQYKEGGFLAGEEVELLGADGTTVWVLLSMEPFAYGDTGAHITWLYDITDRKKAEEVAEEARQAAEEANRAKSDFLSGMSHELRTPLNAIIGFSEFVAEDRDNPISAEQQDCVSQVLRAGRHLQTLIDEVLDLSRIEAGAVLLSIEPVDCTQVIDECISLTSSLAAQSGVTLHNQAVDVELQSIKVDRIRFKQVLLNFLSNGVKYSGEAGEVFVEVLPTRDEWVRIGVRDTGPGIPGDRLPNIFEPFDRLGAENSDVEGTGIGLTITRRLVEQMGGEIGVESTVGEGTAFWVEFRATDEAVNTNVLLEAAEATGLIQGEGKVLHIEDNPTNLDLVRKIMSRQPGLDLIDTTTAEEGLVLAAGELPDVILMDINLPGMNGYEALRRLSDMPETRHIPVIAVTAAATDSDVRKGQSAGFFAYLTKPILAGTLLGTIERALNPAGTGDTTELFGGLQDKVLVVDDLEVNLSIARRQLLKLGIQCDGTRDPSDALQKLIGGEYELALVDISMPGMSGLELTERLREAEAGSNRHTPVLALTAALGSEDDMQRFRDAGMDGQLTKPVILEELASELRRWLPAGIGVRDHEISQGQDTNSSPIDLKLLSDILGMDDKEEFVDLLKMFVEYFPDALKALDVAMDSEDLVQIQNAAHAAKSASSNAAARNLTERLHMIETESEGKPWGALVKEVQGVREEFDRVLEFYETYANGQLPHD